MDLELLAWVHVDVLGCLIVACLLHGAGRLDLELLVLARAGAPSCLIVACLLPWRAEGSLPWRAEGSLLWRAEGSLPLRYIRVGRMYPDCVRIG